MKKLLLLTVFVLTTLLSCSQEIAEFDDYYIYNSLLFSEKNTKIPLQDGILFYYDNSIDSTGLYFYDNNRFYKLLADDEMHWRDTTDGIVYTNGKVYTRIIEVMDTVFFKSRLRYDLSDIDIIENDTISNKEYIIKINTELLSQKTATIDKSTITIDNNGGVNAGMLRMEGGYHYLINENDSLNIILGNTYILKTTNGFVGNTQKGLSQNTHVYANGTDSASVNINIGLQSKNQLQALDVGSKSHTGYNKTMESITILGDNGKTYVDSSVNAKHSMLVYAPVGSELNIKKLKGVEIELEDTYSGGIVNSDTIIALSIINKDGRKGDDVTYGIYEDFKGENILNSKTTFEDTILIRSKIDQQSNTDVYNGIEYFLDRRQDTATLAVTPTSNTYYRSYEYESILDSNEYSGLNKFRFYPYYFQSKAWEDVQYYYAYDVGDLTFGNVLTDKRDFNLATKNYALTGDSIVHGKNTMFALRNIIVNQTTGIFYTPLLKGIDIDLNLSTGTSLGKCYIDDGYGIYIDIDQDNDIQNNFTNLTGFHLEGNAASINQKGIYENFGDNYFTNKVESGDTLQAPFMDIKTEAMIRDSTVIDLIKEHGGGGGTVIGGNDYEVLMSDGVGGVKTNQYLFSNINNWLNVSSAGGDLSTLQHNKLTIYNANVSITGNGGFTPQLGNFRQMQSTSYQDASNTVSTTMTASDNIGGSNYNWNIFDNSASHNMYFNTNGVYIDNYTTGAWTDDYFITKGYADANYAGGSYYTFSLGLTETAGAVKIGGTLTDVVDINISTEAFTLHNTVPVTGDYIESEVNPYSISSSVNTFASSISTDLFGTSITNSDARLYYRDGGGGSNYNRFEALNNKIILRADIGYVEVDGTIINDKGIIANNDLTPDFSGANIWTYNGTANSVTITDIDNPVVGAIYTIIGNSDTYTLTINDSGNFNTSEAIVLGVDDVVQIYVIADNNYIQYSKVVNN